MSLRWKPPRDGCRETPSIPTAACFLCSHSSTRGTIKCTEKFHETPFLHAHQDENGACTEVCAVQPAQLHRTALYVSPHSSPRAYSLFVFLRQHLLVLPRLTLNWRHSDLCLLGAGIIGMLYHIQLSMFILNVGTLYLSLPE